MPAQLDTAADRTILPARLVADMQFAQDGLALFQGFGSELIQLPLYLVSLSIHDFAPVMIRGASAEHEQYILLGRDVLNRLRVLLDGPKLLLEIG
jgi:hypothetical protein